MKARTVFSAALALAHTIPATTMVLAQDEEAAPAEEGECIYCLDVLDSTDFGVVPMGELVAGEPISHWAQEADKWFLSMPFDEHYGPQNDCQASQGGPVFNIQNGPFGMGMHFECEIQPDQYVLVQPGGGMSTSADESPEDLVKQTLHNSMFITNPRVIVDGQEIQMGGSTWISNDPWTYELPEGNILGEPAGEVTVHSAGWFVMLEPLAPGSHTIVVSDDWLAPAYAPWDVDTETGTLNEEFVPIGSPVQAWATFDITVAGGDEEATGEAAADDEASADEEATTE